MHKFIIVIMVALSVWSRIKAPTFPLNPTAAPAIEYVIK